MSPPAARRRVAFFTEVGLIGGAERFVRDVVHGLDRERYEVEVLCARNAAFVEYLRGGAGARPFEVRELPIRTTATSAILAGGKPLRRLRLFYRWRAIPKGIVRYAQDAPNLRLIAGELGRGGYDILHVNNGGYPGAESCRVAAVAAARLGIPVRVMTYHNLAVPPAFPRALDRLVDWRVFRSLGAVAAASRASADSLRSQRAFGGQVHVVPYGIADPGPGSPASVAAVRAELRLQPQDRVVATVGSFEPRKGQEVLVRALPAIRTAHPSVKVVFVGEGERRAAAELLASALGVRDSVVFAGYRRDAVDVMRLAEVLALPSVGHESLPYVVLEAMALGKPVVGTRVGGVPEEIVDGVTGRLVPPDDAEALAAALVPLLSDRGASAAMGARGREKYLEQFTLRRMLARIEELYAQEPDPR